VEGIIGHQSLVVGGRVKEVQQQSASSVRRQENGTALTWALDVGRWTLSVRPSRVTGHCSLFTLCCLLFTVHCSPFTSFAAPATNTAALLAELQLSLAGTTNVQTDFIQEKNLSILRQAVIIKGRLAVSQPDRLAWQVTDPVRYNLVLDGTTLRQWDEATDKVQQMSLAGNPVFGVVATQLRGWFSGHFDTLAKDFDTSIDAAVSPPAITFVPRATSFAAKAIRRVTLTFRDDRRYIHAIQIEECSGDRTLMTFTNTVLNAAVDPALWEVKPHGR